MRLVLVEPDIPQNAGTLMRACACLGVGVDVVEPCGFVLDDRRLRRALMDYGAALDLRRHRSWAAFAAAPAASCCWNRTATGRTMPSCTRPRT